MRSFQKRLRFMYIKLSRVFHFLMFTGDIYKLLFALHNLVRLNMDARYNKREYVLTIGCSISCVDYGLLNATSTEGWSVYLVFVRPLILYVHGRSIATNKQRIARGKLEKMPFQVPYISVHMSQKLRNH